MKKIFIHISDDSLYIGNGGLRSNTHLAHTCAEMGYETYVFGQKDRLAWEKFHWLAWPRDNLDFEIAPIDFLFKQKGDCRIITSWLNRVMEYIDKLDITKIRYLERDELARKKYGHVASFVKSHLDTIGITNRELIKYYSRMGFAKIIPIENWFRRDLFYYRPVLKIPGRVGFQGSKKPQYQSMIKGLGLGKTVACEGDQAEVAKQMRRCEFFVYANPPKKSITLYSGEGFGNPLYEAMACGCICVAVENQSNAYLKDTILLVHDIPEAITLIRSLSEKKKGEIRDKSLVLVEERFRLNDEKKRNIERFLQ